MKDSTYRALNTAAHRIAEREGMAQYRAHVKAGRSPRTFRFNPTEELRTLVAMMGSHTVTDEEAMGYLWNGDVMIQCGRWPDAPKAGTWAAKKRGAAGGPTNG
jgi:hypothetical protein